MRGRMQFPIPLLPMMIVGLVVAAIIPTLLKLCSRHDSVQHSYFPSQPEQTTKHGLHDLDPFSDDPNVTATAQASDRVQITAKFVEIYSGTEELGFDWLVPSEQSTPKE